MKVLIFDIDRGMSSVGTAVELEEMFGYIPRQFVKASSLAKTFDKLFERVLLVREDAIGKSAVEVYRLISEQPIDCLVIDTISTYQVAKRHEVMETAGTTRMDRGMHGELGDDVEQLLLKLTRIDIPLIVTCHIKDIIDAELGIRYIVPGLTGRMSNEISRYFDIVAYAGVQDTEEGTKWYWQMVSSERIPCKNRLRKLNPILQENNGVLNQDFAFLMDKIVKAGYAAPKILIMGDSGSGKTFALNTLKDVALFPKIDYTGTEIIKFKKESKSKQIITNTNKGD